MPRTEAHRRADEKYYKEGRKRSTATVVQIRLSPDEKARYDKARGDLPMAAFFRRCAERFLEEKKI